MSNKSEERTLPVFLLPREVLRVANELVVKVAAIETILINHKAITTRQGQDIIKVIKIVIEGRSSIVPKQASTPTKQTPLSTQTGLRFKSIRSTTINISNLI